MTVHRRTRPTGRQAALFLLLALAAGCARDIHLTVESEVPTPLSEKIPLSLGVHYTEHFTDYVFKEDSEARKDWSIDTREARIALFQGILPSMFQSVVRLDGLPAPAGTPVDVILEPEILDMQVALPEETMQDMYEAWVRYEIRLYDPAGALLSRWEITGYGKTHTALFKKREKGLNTAINLALRDIGAKLVLDFPRAPGVQDWLVGKVDCSALTKLC